MPIFILVLSSVTLIKQPVFGKTQQCFIPKSSSEMCTITVFHPIVSVMCISLEENVVPDDFKQALVNPLIKNKIYGK